MTDILFEAPEIIFSNPDFNLGALVARSIAQSGSNVNSLVFAGGNTMFPGLSSRTVLEARKFGASVKVANPVGERTNLAYYGMQQMAMMHDLFYQIMTTKEMYDEHGPDFIFNKGFLSAFN